MRQPTGSYARAARQLPFFAGCGGRERHGATYRAGVRKPIDRLNPDAKNRPMVEITAESRVLAAAAAADIECEGE